MYVLLQNYFSTFSITVGHCFTPMHAMTTISFFSLFYFYFYIRVPKDYFLLVRGLNLLPSNGTFHPANTFFHNMFNQFVCQSAFTSSFSNILPLFVFLSHVSNTMQSESSTAIDSHDNRSIDVW